MGELQMPRIRYHKGYTNIVKIHNNLIEAHYKFSREQQVILLQVAKTLQEQDIFDKYEHTTVSYNADELLRRLNITDRRTLRGVVKSLQRCIMSFKNLDEQWEADVNIFISGKYHAGGTVDIEIHKDMLQFLKELTERYTELNLKETVQLKSQYAIRLYEWARKLQNIGITKDTKHWKQEQILTIEEFQKQMGSTYKTWQHIESKVLKPAMDELKDNSFIYVDYEPIKGYKKGQTRGKPGVIEIKLKVNKVSHFQPKLI
jgi:plasmid replication initiation protein